MSLWAPMKPTTMAERPKRNRNACRHAEMRDPARLKAKISEFVTCLRVNESNVLPTKPAVQGDEGRSGLDLVVVGGGVGAAVEGGRVDEHLHGLEKELLS